VAKNASSASLGKNLLTDLDSFKALEILLALFLFSLSLLSIYWLEIFSENLSLIFFLLAYLLTGWRIVLKAGQNILKGTLFDENFLMTVATLGAFAIGEAPEAVAVMLFYRIGEYFQDSAVSYSQKSIKELLSLNPDKAKVKVGGQIAEKNVADLQKGDVVIVSRGERIPADGRVKKGRANLDTSALTGESEPQPVIKGNDVKAGMLNLDGALEIEISHPAKESAIAKIINLVEEATARQGKTEKFISRVAGYYTPIVVGMAVLIATFPPLILGASWQQWVYRALIFLVISCPCALVISIPLSFFAGLASLARQGILFNGSEFIEKLAEIKNVIYDKTGTLTEGEMKLREVNIVNDYDKDEILKLVLAAEQYSNHPLAKALWEDKDLKGKFKDLPEVNHIEEKPGQGLVATFDNKKLKIGNRKWLEEDLGLNFPADQSSGAQILVAIAEEPAAVLSFSDTIRRGMKELIVDLKSAGIIEQLILSGDKEKTVDKVAENLGISYQADLLPEDKMTLLEKFLEDKSGKTAYLGDGINDAPALARADVGIAMGGMGSDIALESAEVVIMNDDPRRLLTGLQISRTTMKIVWQNIILALGIKVLIMLTGLMGVTNLWLAVFADVGVTILAVLNSLRIIWKYRGKEDHDE